jgi:hypothetical protein
MATKLGGYIFSNSDSYEAAKDSLYNQLYSDYRDSDKIYFYGSYGSDYLIEIYSDCSDAQLAGQICRTFGGKPYNR